MHNAKQQFLIKLCIVKELLSVKHRNTSPPRKQPQTFDPVCHITKGPMTRIEYGRK